MLNDQNQSIIPKPMQAWEVLIQWIAEDPETRSDFVIRGTTALKLAYGLDRDPKDIDLLSRRVWMDGATQVEIDDCAKCIANLFDRKASRYRPQRGMPPLETLRAFPLQIRPCYLKFRARQLHHRKGWILVPDAEYLLAEKIKAIAMVPMSRASRTKDVIDIVSLLQNGIQEPELRRVRSYMDDLFVTTTLGSFADFQFDEKLAMQLLTYDSLHSDSIRTFQDAWAIMTGWLHRVQCVSK